MAANCSPTRVEGNARLELIRDGKTCNMKFLDVDVKRPLARGKHRRVRTAGTVHREHEQWPEDSNEQDERCVCGALGRTNGFDNDDKSEVRRAEHE